MRPPPAPPACFCSLASGGPSHQVAIAREGGVPVLGRLLSLGIGQPKSGAVEVAAWALQKLAARQGAIQEEVRTSGALADLTVALAIGLDDETTEKVAWALYECAAGNRASCSAVVVLGGVSSLVRDVLLARDAAPAVLKAGLWALCTLASGCESAREQAGALGALDWLAHLLSSRRDEELRAAALAALASLASGNSGNQTLAQQAGLSELLVHELRAKRALWLVPATDSPTVMPPAQHCFAAIQALAINHAGIQSELLASGALRLLMPRLPSSCCDSGRYDSVSSASWLQQVRDDSDEAGDSFLPPAEADRRDVLEDALQLLAAATRGHVGCQTEAVSCGALDAILQCLQHKQRATQSAAATALHEAITGNHGAQATAFKVGALPGLLGAVSLGVADAGRALAALLDGHRTGNSQPTRDSWRGELLTAHAKPCVHAVVDAMNRAVMSSPVDEDLAAVCVRCFSLLQPHATPLLLATPAPAQLAFCSSWTTRQPELAMEALAILVALTTSGDEGHTVLHLHALPMALMALKDARYEPARIAAVDAVRALVQHCPVAARRFLAAGGAQELVRLAKMGPFYESTTAAMKTLSFLSSSAPDVIAQALVASDYAGVLAMLDLLAAGTLDDLTAALLSLLHITMLCERDIAEVLSELGAASHLEAIIATSADTVHDPTGSRTGAAGSCDDRVSDGVGASSKDLPRLAESCLSAMRATNRESSDAGELAYACAALCIHDDDNHGGETAPEVIKLTRVTDSTTPPSPGHCSSMAAAAPAMTAAAIGALPPTVIAAAVDKAGIEGSPKQSR
eukprot:jgi/Tetstr1/461140/TSEL_006278.t1